MERNGPASANQGFCTASQSSAEVHGTSCWKPPNSPYPTFLLMQNLSSKQIVPTDNMRSKLHDEYAHHQWLEGY